jgi:hypothetical protein
MINTENGDGMSKILCWLGIHLYFYWVDRPKNLSMRACGRCGKAQYLIGSPDGQLYWMNEIIGWIDK